MHTYILCLVALYSLPLAVGSSHCFLQILLSLRWVLEVDEVGSRRMLASKCACMMQ